MARAQGLRVVAGEPRRRNDCGAQGDDVARFRLRRAPAPPAQAADLRRVSSDTTGVFMPSARDARSSAILSCRRMRANAFLTSVLLLLTSRNAGLTIDFIVGL